MSDVAELTMEPELAEQDGQPARCTDKLSVGAQLLLARTNQKLSIEQVAGQLKWSSRQIAEVEAGNYAVLPDLSSIRGFVRTYAKILRIDSAPLLQALSTEFASQPDPSVVEPKRPMLDAPFPSGRMPWLGRHSSRTQRFVGGLFLVLLCLTAVFVYRGEMAGWIPDVGSNETAVATEGHSTTSEPKAEKPIDLSLTSATESRRLDASAEQVGLVNDGVSSQQQEHPPQKQIELNAQNPVQGNAVSSGENALILNFKRDSWVQIKNSKGEKVISHLYKAGAEEVVQVTVPLNIIVGFAPGVEAKLRGEPLELKTPKGGSVAILSIK